MSKIVILHNYCLGRIEALANIKLKVGKRAEGKVNSARKRKKGEDTTKILKNA